MPDLAIIVPVLNEADNIRPVLDRLQLALEGISWEVVFVDDDSPDGTAEVCRQCAAEDPRVRVIHRVGRTGLASACIEGMMSTATPWVAVMDGDLQHDESILPAMLRTEMENRLDVVVASRNMTGGSMGEFSNRRIWLSHVGRRISTLIVKANITDPMSGFFVVSRSFLLEVVYGLSGCGFKILLDLLASSPRPVRLAEVPFTFRSRRHGASKLDTAVGIDFVLLVADKLFGNVLPVRFALYLLVGAAGVLVHLAALSALRATMPAHGIVVHQVLATLVAILSNFFLNNEITFRDRKLRGWRRICRGAFWYSVACSVGAVANVGTTRLLADGGFQWYAAGAAGALITALWNFAAASLLAWKIGQRRRGFRRGRNRSLSSASAAALEGSGLETR
jgi:dolichol-phosphate mannosyltransferase